MHDPAIVRDGANYYVFGSHLASASTSDLMNWTQISTSAAVGNPLVPNPAQEFQEALTWAQTNTFWAPDVFRLPDGRYAFYYCACKGDSPRSALGLAVSNSITGPYTNVAVFLKSGMWGQVSPDGLVYDNAIHPNVVDPSIFYDAAGTLWMVYGSYSGGIFIMRLNPATGLPYDGQGYGTRLIGGNNTTIEGPHILYVPQTQYYYLFMTYGGLAAADGYNVRMGRSVNPDGPYLDAAGNDLTNVKGAPGTLFDNASIAPYGVKLMGNWQFMNAAGEVSSTSTGYLSPGGVQTHYNPENGKFIMSLHTRFVGRGEQHEVRVHQLYLNEDGWFVAAPHRFAHETIATTDSNQVPGSYKLVNHGKDITGAVKQSMLVTLAANGTISGASTGTWQVSGDHYATIAVDGTTYKGVFAQQWDDDKKRWVLTFSALSTSGVSIWGSKVAIDAAPAWAAQPEGKSIVEGQSATFAASATGSPLPSYQWRRNGVNIPGATGNSYTVSNATTADAGDYTVVATNSSGSITSAAGALTVIQIPPQVHVPNGDSTAQIINLSTRGIVAEGDNVLVAGFMIDGPAAKKVLILGHGLNLKVRYGLAAVGRPLLKLYRSNGDGTNTLVAENRDWETASAEVPALIDQVAAPRLQPSSDPAEGDAAIVMTLQPSLYSVVVSPAEASVIKDGIGLVEVYDISRTDGSRLANISSRGRIESDAARQMFVGVGLTGSGHARLLIRGVGPSMLSFLPTALTDPSLKLYEGQTQLTLNDDWWVSAQADQIGTTFVGQFPLETRSADAVLLERLPVGSYSAIITSNTGQPGVALAEIYDANDR